MIRMEMSGGTGNQLFIYALYRVMQMEGKKVILDLSWYRNVNDSTHAKYHLDKFKTKVDSYMVPYAWDRIRHIVRRRKLDAKLSRLGLYSKYMESTPGVYDEKVFDVKRGYVTGTWQSEAYFAKYRDLIRDELQYTGEWSSSNLEIRNQMLESESVSIHVRRGDYLKFNQLYGNICTDEYYERAYKTISLMLSERRNVRYFVFSDDIPWCKDQLFSGQQNVTYVTGNEGDASYMDLVLMTYCKHHILANSSFSWWGEWLSDQQGITIAPKTWINGVDMKDIWRPGWIKV